MKKHFSPILCIILSVVVMNTCIQIEVWNYLAGGNVLPNREGGKLRYAAGETEKEWRELIMRTDPTLESGRPLTEAEKELFREHSNYARSWNNLVSWSSGMGTLQYLFAPIAFIWSIFLLFKRKTRRARLIAGVLSLTNTVCILLMFYRGYFND